MMTRTAAPGALPPGVRVYAIGDVHGCLDRLVSLHYAIAADLDARPVARSVLVHVGDYVDRGPDSAGVLFLLTGEVAPPVTQRVELMGNHEVMMAEALEGLGGPEAGEHWLLNGGDATLESYGVSSMLAPSAWREQVPIEHRQWIRSREVVHVEGDYVFVHAGLKPGRPLAEQTTRDLLWIREPFLSDGSPHGYVVVHGHTPREQPDIRSNRIGIDTGAAMGGNLTCVILEENRLAFLQS